MTGFKTRKGYAAEYLEARTDAQEMTTYCANCVPHQWIWTGRADEARERMRVHREAKHPETLKPKQKGKRFWRSDRTKKDPRRSEGSEHGAERS